MLSLIKLLWSLVSSLVKKICENIVVLTLVNVSLLNKRFTQYSVTRYCKLGLFSSTSGKVLFVPVSVYVCLFVCTLSAFKAF